MLDEKRPHERTHPEWDEHHIFWDWMYDSWEGGPRYREATYGTRGNFPLFNLRRHKRELPDKPLSSLDDGSAWSDDFELRRDRTPVPDWVESAADTHLSKIFSQEITRKGPPELEEFWKDVDGLGTTIAQMMEDVLGPLSMVLGQIDVQCDRPKDPPGEEIVTEADVRAEGLRRVVLSYALPQNVRWWKLDSRGRYEEVIIQENCEDGVKFRHWTKTEWTLYDARGTIVEGPTDHDFGRPPVSRGFYRRKPRCNHIGRSRYQTVAYLAREYYNRDSELILSDTTQAHPLIQGPEDYIKADGMVTVGPAWLLPKKKTANGSSVHYEGYDVVEFPKGGADSIRLNKADMRDAADRDALLLKPPGAAGTGGDTVAQSGTSKRLDQDQGNNFLAKVATRLQILEMLIARLAWLVITDGQSDDPPGLLIVYPQTFDLASPEEMGKAITSYQSIIGDAGRSPVVESAMIKQFVRVNFKGLPVEVYAKFDAEIDEVVAAAKVEKDRMKEAAVNGLMPDANGQANSLPAPNGKPAGRTVVDIDEDGN